MKHKVLIVLILIVCNFGCQKQFYRESDFNNVFVKPFYNSLGYSENKLGENLYLVKYLDEYGYHSAFHKCLMRSSEIALLEGNKYFVIKAINPNLGGIENYWIHDKAYPKKNWSESNIKSVKRELYDFKGTKKESDAKFVLTDWGKITTPRTKMGERGYFAIKVEFYFEKPEGFSFDAKNTFQKLHQRYFIQKPPLAIDTNNESISFLAIDENTTLVLCNNYDENSTATVELNLFASVAYCKKNNFKSFDILASNYDAKVAKSILNDSSLLNQKNDYHLPKNNSASYSIIQGNNDAGQQKLDDVYAAILKKYSEISLSKRPKPPTKSSGNIKLGN